MSKRVLWEDEPTLVSPPTKTQRILSGHSPPYLALSMSNCWDISADAMKAMSADRLMAAVFNDLDVSHNGFLTEAELSLILGMSNAVRAPHLTSLNLSFSSISDEFIVALARYAPNLRSIYMEGCTSITDAALVALAQNCPSLTALSLAKCQQVSDVGLAAMSRGLPQLQSLDLRECRSVTGKAMKHIVARCPLIQTLLIGGTSIDEETLFWLFSFFLLVDLDVSNLPLKDRHLALLAKKQPLLKKLNISFCHDLTQAGIENFLAQSTVGAVAAFGLFDGAQAIEDSRLAF